MSHCRPETKAKNIGDWVIVLVEDACANQRLGNTLHLYLKKWILLLSCGNSWNVPTEAAFAGRKESLPWQQICLFGSPAGEVGAQKLGNFSPMHFRQQQSAEGIDVKLPNINF
jgi:hypothetical protein